MVLVMLLTSIVEGVRSSADLGREREIWDIGKKLRHQLSLLRRGETEPTWESNVCGKQTVAWITVDGRCSLGKKCEYWKELNGRGAAHSYGQ